MRLLDRILGPREEINGGERCPTYLVRWVVLSLPWFKVYLHHFVGDDWSLDLHDHPKRFISVGLWGWYREWVYLRDHIDPLEPDYEEIREVRIWRAPWIRTFPASHRHRIECPSRNCWTLVIVGRPEREWGFWNLGRFIPWRTYIGSELADQRKACD